MAGGYLVTGFGTTYFGGNRDPGPFNLTAAKNRPWEEQIGQLPAILTTMDWWKLAPHDELLTCDTPRGKEGQEYGRTVPPATTYWCLADPGRQYLLYARGLSRPVQLTLESAAGQLAVARYNPRTGEKADLEPAAAGVRYQFVPPDAQDWVVSLTAAKKP
jgi:hypothetical protein